MRRLYPRFAARNCDECGSAEVLRVFMRAVVRAHRAMQQAQKTIGLNLPYQLFPLQAYKEFSITMPWHSDQTQSELVCDDRVLAFNVVGEGIRLSETHHGGKWLSRLTLTLFTAGCDDPEAFNKMA